MNREWKVGRTALATGITIAILVGAIAGGVPAAQAAGAAGPVTVGSKCLDDADFGTANGNVIQIFDCNGASAQNWTWQDDGSVTVSIGTTTKCLDITGASNATGALVQLYTCVSGVAQQKFKWLTDGTIYSVKSGKCLAVQSNSVANYARIGLASCDPSQATQVWKATTAQKPKYLLSKGASVAFSHGDDSPASPFTDANGKFYFQSSHALYGATESRKWSFFSGADFDTATLDPISNAVNPNNSADSNADTTWRCNNSPTGLTATSAPTGSSYSQRNYCDLVGVWVDPDTGWWHGLVHNEFTPQPFEDGLHFDAIDSAVSQDHGATWAIQEQALTSPFSTLRGDTAAFPNSTYSYGDGDQRLFVDNASGYFYVFYATRALNKTGAAIWLQHVARAPISQKMAAASWKKWYNGAWQSPGVGGAESNIIPSEGLGTGYTAPGEDYSPSTTGTVATQVANGTMPDNSQLAVMNIAWSAYLGKYIGTPQNNIAQNTGTNTPLHFYSTDDLATQKWSDLGLVTDAADGSWYRWLLDSANKTSSTILGKTFRSYCMFYCPGGSTEVTIAPRTSADLPAPAVDGSKLYQIAASNGQYLTQSGSSLATASAATTATQQWKFTATGDGFFTVSNSASGQALGVGGGDTDRAWGAAVALSTLGAAPAVGQQWSIQRIIQSPVSSGASVPTGNFRLVNRFSGLVLSLTNQGSQSVLTAPQRGWDNTGTTGDVRPAAAQALTFTSSSSASTNTVTVAVPNDQTSVPGTSVAAVQINATDSASGQTLTYSASGLPAGLSLNPVTGRITGTPASVGSKTVTVTVADGTGASGFATFNWTVSGTDIALNRPTTSSSVEPGSALNANLATDGNPGTRWASAYSDAQWLQVDLGSVRSINEVQLSWEAAYGRVYQIQTSNDGTNWTTIYSTTSGSGGAEDLVGLSGSGQFIRMNGVTRGSGFGYSLYSFQVYSF